MNELITLETAIKECVAQPEFMHNYKRLTGARLNLGEGSSEDMIDKATGYQEKEWFDFFNFVRDYVWIPVLMNQLKEAKKSADKK